MGSYVLDQGIRVFALALWSAFSMCPIADWSFYHVKSHQNMDAGNDVERNWEIWYNNSVDVHAKAANGHRALDAKQLYRRATHSVSFVAQQASVAYKVQTDVLHFAGSSKPTMDTTQITPVLDVEGSTVSFVVPLHDDFGDSLLCPPFLDVLQASIRETVWVQTGVGCSVPELYAAFVTLTGWVVPINIGHWPLSKQPVAWRTPATTSIWIQETSYPEMAMCRQSFSKQCNTFMTALRFICKRNKDNTRWHALDTLLPFLLSHGGPLLSCTIQSCSSRPRSVRVRWKSSTRKCLPRRLVHDQLRLHSRCSGIPAAYNVASASAPSCLTVLAH